MLRPALFRLLSRRSATCIRMQHGGTRPPPAARSAGPSKGGSGTLRRSAEALQSRLLLLTSPQEIIQFYASERHVSFPGGVPVRPGARRSARPPPAGAPSPDSLASALLFVALALSRVSATLHRKSAADLVAARSTGLTAMLDDLGDLTAAAAVLPITHPARAAVSEPRFVAATLHCLTRLHEHLAVRKDTAFSLLLRLALKPGSPFVDGLSGPPPPVHSIAQLAWAVAKYPRDAILQAAEGEGESWVWARVATGIERAASLPAPVEARPLDLSMLAAAAVHAGDATARIFGAIATLAVDKRSHASVRLGRPLIEFSGAVLVALSSSLAAAYSTWARRRTFEPTQKAQQAASIGAAVHSAVAAALEKPSELRERDGSMSPAAHPAVVRLLSATAEEVAVRLALAEAELDGAVPAHPLPASRQAGLRSQGRGTPELSSPLGSDDARLPGIFARAHGSDPDAEDVDVSTVAALSGDAASPPPLPVTLLAPLLRAYATLGFASPHLFGAAARFLGLVSSSSGSDSGGAAGYRALGTHAGDRVAGAPLLKQLADVDGDVAVISTAPFKSLVMFAAAFSRARYADDDGTPRMWAALLASAMARLHIEEKGSVASLLTLNDQSNSVSRFRGRARADPVEPADVAHLLHACVDASIPAAQLAREALEHVRVRAHAYPVSAAARVLWAAAMQGVYDADASAAVFEDVSRRATASPPLDAPRSGAPDEFPAALLAVPEDAKASRIPPPVRVVQSQLYMAWLGLSLEGGRGAAPPAVAAALATLPAPLLAACRSAYVRAEASPHNHRSFLHAEVGRLLGLAGIPHATEVLLPEGLCVDITVPCEHATPPPPRAAAAVAASPAPPRPFVVLEVNGPTHYAPPSQGATEAGLGAVQASDLRGPPTPTVLPRDTKLPPHALTSLGADWDAGGDSAADAASQAALVPSLRTRTRSRWLAAAGYETVTLDWAEWLRYPSTQERLELLAEKGLRIPRHLLSY